MKIEPLDDRILVTPEDGAEQRTAGGLFIPETAREKPRTARVLAVGTDEDLRTRLKEGDRILYGKYTGDELELEGQKLLVLQRNEVLAVLRD